MAGRPHPATLETALDELYGADPADFVATRKRLAAELRTGGSASAANELQSARRPTNAAWALNQLARREPAVIEALLDRSRALRAAQTRAVSGRPDALRDATRAHRRAFGETVDAALSVLGRHANELYRAQITSTLQAASTDEELGEQLGAGRLTRELESPGGFPQTSGLTLVPAPEHAAEPASEPSSARGRRGGGEAVSTSSDERRARSRSEGRRIEAALGQVESARRAAEDTAAAEEAGAVRAEQRVEALRGELDRARQDARASKARAVAARREAARLDKEVGRRRSAAAEDHRDESRP